MRRQSPVPRQFNVEGARGGDDGPKHTSSTLNCGGDGGLKQARGKYARGLFFAITGTPSRGVASNPAEAKTMYHATFSLLRAYRPARFRLRVCTVPPDMCHARNLEHAWRKQEAWQHRAAFALERVNRPAGHVPRPRSPSCAMKTKHTNAHGNRSHAPAAACFRE